MPTLLKRTVILLLWVPAVFCMVTTTEQQTVLEGRSITFPCHYEPQYASYVKYWCWGRTRVWCTTLARTDNPHSDDPAEAKVSILDSPGDLASIVTMNNLTEADTGWYSCGVEVGNGLTPDVFKFIYINVIHGLSVAENKVCGEVGEEVSVKCHYSERLRGNEKKWCPMGDWSSCRMAGPEGNCKDALASICDDGNGMFTVTLRNLQLSDAGWYWCIVGQMQLGVEVQVTPSLRTSVNHLSTWSHFEAPPSPPSYWFISLTFVASCSLLVVMYLCRNNRPRHVATLYGPHNAKFLPPSSSFVPRPKVA